jgi:fluoroacetyl-CoA thioesterase
MRGNGGHKSDWRAQSIRRMETKREYDTAGSEGRFTLVVAPEHLASQLKDPTLPPVLATPIMILAMENAAVNAVRDYLEPGESVVGTAVDIHHLAATPVGQHVIAEAEVTRIEGRRIAFAVTARDDAEKIGGASMSGWWWISAAWPSASRQRPTRDRRIQSLKKHLPLAGLLT